MQIPHAALEVAMVFCGSNRLQPPMMLLAISATPAVVSMINSIVVGTIMAVAALALNFTRSHPVIPAARWPLQQVTATEKAEIGRGLRGQQEAATLPRSQGRSWPLVATGANAKGREAA